MLETRGIATNIFGGLAEKYGGNFTYVKEYLPKADMRVTFKNYLSYVFFLSATAFLVTAIAAPIFLFAIDLGINLILKVAMAIFIPFIVGAATFVMFSFYPYQKSVSRTKNIESNLPFVLTHMGAVAESGIPPYVIFKLIGQFGEYGEVAKEMQKIVRNVDTFGLDPLTAAKEVAERTPSESLKQVLLGYITTTESGGDIKLYLKSSGEQALFDWRIKRERFLQEISAYAEFYTGILIAAPLFIVSLFAVMSLIQPELAGFNIVFLTQMSIYVLIPVINVIFLLFLKGIEVEI